MEKNITKMKGKKALSMLLALIMVLSVLSPAISPLDGIIASAADITGTSDEQAYPVELAFQNLFVFEDWATNSLSSTVIIDGAAQPEDANLLETDIENGSFTFYKKDMAAAETYTAFSMSETDAALNSRYYMMPVEPNTKYTFSYNVEGTIHLFTPFVFMYTNEGLFAGLDKMVAYGTPGYGNNSFNFTTPANVTSIQIRFTIGDDTTTPEGNSSADSVYATVKDIAIYKTELKDAYFADRNLFKLEEWVSNTNSSTTPSTGLGTVTPNVSDGSIRFVNSGTGYLWTGFGVDQENSNDAYYTMTVSPNTSYTLTYDLTDQNLLGPIYLQPFIVEMRDDGTCITYYANPTASLTNKFQFTTQAATVRIQLVFALITDGDNTASAENPRYVTVNNIGIYETSVYSSDVDEILGHTHRQAYTYTTNNNGTYGELPVPSNVPKGQVFAGWYTGQNGTGEYISADTPVSYNSYTVYPKYEPAVDSLEIVTPATKLTYTAGEKVDTTGLVLKATRTYTVNITDENGNVTGTEQKTDTFNITSGFRFSPKSLTSTGTQAVEVEYGGETVTYNVTVNASEEKTVTVNGAEHTAYVANNKYTLEYSTTPFNRYEMTYYSDSYVKGVITMDADTEEFFLEPSDNGRFASYIDSFLRGIQHYSVVSIEFTCLDKEFGKFELYSVTTIDAPVPSDPTQYYQNDEYKVGISLDYGGVVSYIEDLDDDVSAAVYNENGQNITRVDYTSKLPSGATATSNSVNLINTNDRGRYLQQSYYGTDQPPYVMGSYNGLPWSYNPVQGGNISQFDPVSGELVKGAEASKVIDYRITADQIYIKTRPLDWGKNSEDYPDSYITDSYMEAWYTFENGMIKTTCRFVDYSGYPSNTTTQEYPALYTIEPLNHFVYNDTTAETAWDAASVAWQTDGMTNIEEPDFWGVLPEYNALLTQNGMPTVDVDVDCYENWAAFTASSDADSFGIGVYSAGITDFHYGVFPAIYNEDQVKNGNLVANYRHTQSLDPAVESPTSYISPVGTMTFESYKPSTYSFYVTTGTADQIREDFRQVESIESGEALAQTKVAVPETVYMAPVDGASTVGEIYVNNILDSNDFYNVTTLAEREDNMYFGIHIADAAYFTVDVSNATDPSNDINLCTTAGSAVSTTQQFEFVDGTFTNDGQYELRFSGTGLNPGEKATAKWDITVTMNDGSTQKYAYYTVMYAPERTVGAVAEARKEEISQNEISSWITGANGVDHSQRSPLGSFHGDYSASGYFKEDPLVYDAPLTNITCSGETADDLINVATEYSDNAYVLQTATNGHDHSRAQSYLGLLKVDKSRYTNTNQIPNLEIGYDVLRVSTPSRSLADYYTLYTLGTSESFTSTDVKERPSDWTSFATTTNSDSTIPVRETVIPSYAVSDIDGKYIHALNQARCWYTADMGESAGNTMGLNSYSTAGTSVLCSVTDKSSLRESVLTGYGVTNTDATFDEALENAATVLGDPSATQEEIDNASKELNDAMQEKVDVYYALKYDNLFSAYEYSQYAASMTVVSDRGTATYSNGALTVVNDTITGGEAYTNYGSAADYYHVTLKPNTEYVFEYDVTTTLNAQAFMFFYNSTGGNGDAPTNMSIKVDDGNWSSKSESNPWWGNYTNGAGSKHYAIKFTTGANTTQAGFRFGNTSNDPVTSTFSNIKLVDSAHYYENATYSKTEELFKEYATYGAITAPVRPGYTFNGWVDANGTAVTGAEIATEHKSIYSVWNENSYTVNYDKNGADVGSADAKIFKYTEEFALPADFSRDYYMFKGWAYEADATAPVFTPGQTISFADIQADKISSDNQVTLYAVWEKGYSLYYSPNNGTGELAGTFKGYTEAHTVKENTTITRDGYTFLGWSLDQNATTPSYYAGDELIVSAIDSKYIQKDADNELQTFVVLHAVWSEHAYTISYNANGGDGSVADQNTMYATQTTLANGGFTKDKYTLIGWSTDPNATNAQYGLGESVSKLTTVDGGEVTLYAVWELAEYISADTVVIDFGLPVKIDVLGNDEAASTGTLVAIGKGVQDGTVLNTEGYTSSRLTGNADTLTLNNGTAKIVDGKIVYTPTSTNYEAEEVLYYEFKTADNKFYYAAVTVIPATSIYFEETMFTFTDSVVTVDGVEKEYKWQDAGTSLGERFQSEDRPGTFTIDDADAVYGTDSAYNDSTTYSMGTAKYITVDQNSNKANPLATASFTFTGTGFDLFTATDSQAGLLTVSIYKDGTRVKGLAVNTYYGYTYDENANDGQGGYVATNGANALFQVPAIRARDLDYGTYTVVVEPKYSYPFDVNLNYNYRVYVDSVRIYDPMGADNDVANNAYLADGEYAPDYLRLRDTVVTKDANGDYNVSTYENSSLFFDGFNADMNDVTDVIKNGPKNEVYLAKGQAVAFNISATSTLNVASVQLGMKLISANGNAQVTIMNTQEQQPEEITLTSATEQFYRLDSAVVWDEDQISAGTYNTLYPIVILNSSDEDVVISLTTLKWAFADAGASISTFNIVGDEQTLAFAPAAIERAMTISAVNPVAPENIAIDSPDTIYLEDGKGEFTITTEAEIIKVTVNGVELTDCEINEEGQKTWKYSFEVEEPGESVFEVVVYDDEGNQSETITNRINVAIEDGNDDSADGNDSLTGGIFTNEWIKMIFDLIKKIFELLGGALA